MTLNSEQLKQVEKLASLNYTIRQVAMYLDIPVSELYKEFNNEESEFRYHYDRGKLISQAEIDMSIVESATGGSITAQQQFEKIRQARHFENLRDKMLNGD